MDRTPSEARGHRSAYLFVCCTLGILAVGLAIVLVPILECSDCATWVSNRRNGHQLHSVPPCLRCNGRERLTIADRIINGKSRTLEVVEPRSQ